MPRPQRIDHEDAWHHVMNRGVAPGSYVALEVTDNGCGMPK